jgi:branched-chain amino acid transport system ATP-binding protein
VDLASAPPHDPALAIGNLEVAYGDQQVLWGVSLIVNHGETVAIIGPNGAGKTSLLRSIAGLLPPLRGTITYRGSRIDGTPPNAIVAQGLALVAEGRRLFQSMTVLENLELGAYLPRARAQRHKTLDEILTLLPFLGERRRQLAGTLSGGEQQMLAIARALMGRPQMLLLDEPSMGLAPIMVDNVFEAIASIVSRGVTVLLVEQSAFRALEQADRAYILREGRIVAHGLPQALLAEEDFRRRYIGV